jgi:multidrug efflux pump subunit AcrB
MADYFGLGTDSLLVAAEAARVRSTPDALKNIKVKAAGGVRVALGDVAEIRETIDEPARLRVNLYPALRITAAVPPGKTLVEVMAACMKAAKEEAPKDFKVFDLSGGKP